jgi:hypothetical protein
MHEALGQRRASEVDLNESARLGRQPPNTRDRRSSVPARHREKRGAASGWNRKE